MPFDQPRDEDLPDVVLRLDQIASLLKEDGWVQHGWDDEGMRCLGQAVLDAYGIWRNPEQRLPTELNTLPVVRPIRQAIREITGRNFQNIPRFNDLPSTTVDIIFAVIHRARENCLAAHRANAPQVEVVPAPAPAPRMRFARLFGLVPA